MCTVMYGSEALSCAILFRWFSQMSKISAWYRAQRKIHRKIQWYIAKVNLLTVRKKLIDDNQYTYERKKY